MSDLCIVKDLSAYVTMTKSQRGENQVLVNHPQVIVTSYFQSHNVPVSETYILLPA